MDEPIRSEGRVISEVQWLMSRDDQRHALTYFQEASIEDQWNFLKVDKSRSGLWISVTGFALLSQIPQEGICGLRAS